MGKRMLLLLALVAATLVAGCDRNQGADGTDTASRPFVAYESEEFGVTLKHPDDWEVHTGFSGLTVASDRLVIDTDSLSEIGDGAFVNIIPGELAVFGMQAGETFDAGDPEAVLQTYRRLLENEGQVYTVLEPATTSTVDGENVASMVVSSPVEGETLVTMLSVVINDDFVALVSAGALEGAFDNVQPTLEQIVHSIVVSPPAGGGR